MKILVVEDDLALSDVIAFTLRRNGFETITSHDGQAALRTWEAEQPDMVLLDLNLPKLDGMSVCRQIRAQATTPIIMLSVRNSDEAIVQGLEIGADDYIVKPFSPSQLVARIRAVLRRTGAGATPESVGSDRLALDRSRSEVNAPGFPPVRLAPLELRLLETLIVNAGAVVPADRLIAAIWGVDGGDRTMLKQLVYRLRSRLDTELPGVATIETVPGIGYALLTDSDA
ncbi:MAG: response regulator transcription factor [Anaerolineales bacterium]|nr:response regulator transcription factor [Anaerolineales bacterium]